MVMDLHPNRGGFLRPFLLGVFIRDYLLGKGPFGSEIIDSDRQLYLYKPKTFRNFSSVLAISSSRLSLCPTEVKAFKTPEFIQLILTSHLEGSSTVASNINQEGGKDK
ncbi:MAG: hypothetical protein DDT32_01243 [Syntrophomonadaceae bacterium]|nr:hypothetical protein [Bacillota bacterium]